MTCRPRRTGRTARADPGEPDWPWPCGPPPVTGSMIAAVTDDLSATSPASRRMCSSSQGSGWLGYRVGRDLAEDPARWSRSNVRATCTAGGRRCGRAASGIWGSRVENRPGYRTPRTRIQPYREQHDTGIELDGPRHLVPGPRHVRRGGNRRAWSKIIRHAEKRGRYSRLVSQRAVPARATAALRGT